MNLASHDNMKMPIAIPTSKARTIRIPPFTPDVFGGVLEVTLVSAISE
jgi:hypothetical protein